jgi:hypothetical protein
VSRILLFDLETAPNTGYTWGKWDQNVINFEKPWYILCVGYKWLGDKRVTVVGNDDYVRGPDDDLGVTQHLHALFSEADILVAHNADQFDIPKARARMIIHGMTPPTPAKTVDTLKLARREFKFNGNGLDDLCQVLDIGRKTSTGGFDTWLGCMAGDPVAWRRMKQYCASDVKLLEQLYERLVPWGTNPAPVNLGVDGADKCPRCGKGPMLRQGFKEYKVTRKQRYQCKACSGWCVGRAIEKLETRYTL